MANTSIASNAIIDLHLHTTNSDGEWTPTSLLDYLLNEQFWMHQYPCKIVLKDA